MSAALTKLGLRIELGPFFEILSHYFKLMINSLVGGDTLPLEPDMGPNYHDYSEELNFHYLCRNSGK